MADISQIVSIDGNQYNLKDAQARADIQKYLPLIPDFDNATPVRSYNFDISSSSIYELCRRANTSAANGTNYEKAHEDIAFRLTITSTASTSIKVIIDVLVMWQGALVNPLVIANNRTYSSSASTTGLRYMYFSYPKTGNSASYPWLIDIAAYNATKRNIKVEVFKDSSNITWKETATATIYNEDYWTRQSITLYTTRGIVTNTNYVSTMKVSNATTADKASYITTYLPEFLTGVPPSAGEALIKNGLVYVSEDKLWKASNKTKPLVPDAGIMCCTSAYAANGATTYPYFRQKGQMTSITADSGITWGSFVKGDPLYLRCTTSGGNVYSDAYVSNAMAPGYTWGYIGIAESSTGILFDGGKGPFITLDSNGEVTHINGKSCGGTAVSASNGSNGYLDSVTIGSTTYNVEPVSLSGNTISIGHDSITVATNGDIPTVPSVSLSNQLLTVNSTSMTIPVINNGVSNLDFYIDWDTGSPIIQNITVGNTECTIQVNPDNVRFWIYYNTTSFWDCLMAFGYGLVMMFMDEDNSRITATAYTDKNGHYDFIDSYNYWTVHFIVVDVDPDIAGQYLIYDYAINKNGWSVETKPLSQDRRINITYNSTTFSEAMSAMSNGIPFFMDPTNGFMGGTARWDQSTYTVYFEFPTQNSYGNDELVRYSLSATGWSRQVIPQGITSASITSSGLISFNNNIQTAFTLQLPIYNGEVS